jgi:hypothetical protein
VRGRTAASSRMTQTIESEPTVTPEETAAAKKAKSASKAPAAPKPKVRQVKHSRGALQARNRKRGGGR